MILLVTFATLTFASLDASPIHSDGCSVSLKDLGELQPLVLVKRGLNVSYVYPEDTNGTLHFKSNEEFRLACIGDHNYLVGVGDNDTQDIAAFCISGKTFRVNSIEYKFGALKCSTTVLSVVRRTGKTCLDNCTQIEIGFDLGNEFLRTIELCRNEDVYRTVYTKFKLTKTIGNFQTRQRRPSWRQANFWGRYDIVTQYKRSVQKATVSHILNSTELGDKYVTNTTNFYSRGHLVAKADFLYGTARRSTFWYVNAAPQWQKFNGGNWKLLEMVVREYANAVQLDLDVYTGTHGTMKLPDADDNEQPLYLYASGSDRVFEIPLFFWKIIHDPLSQNGTAFVGVNNPYIANLTVEYYICKDISSELSYLKWNRNDKSQGILYACAVDDLRKGVPTLPELTVVDLLK